jgi:hypothetical protein
MAELVKCNQAHWQGDKFIPEGTIRPAGHAEAIPAFFEPFEVEGATPAKAVKKS